MTTIRKTIQWICLLLLLGTAAAGGFAFYYWNESDELLGQALHERIQEIVPDWHVTFSRARLDFQGRIHVYDFSLKGADGQSPLLDIAEIVLVVDRERLADPQTPMRLVRWIRPKLHLERDRKGVWNFQQLTRPKLPRNVIPEFHAEQMNLAILVADPESGLPARADVEQASLQLIPSGAREFLVKASAKFAHSEGVAVEGKWQIDVGAWDLAGQLKKATLDAAVSKLVSDFSPECRTGLQRADALISRLSAASDTRAAEPGRASSPAGSAGLPAGSQSESPADCIARLGLSAVADVQFRVTKRRSWADAEYKISLQILDGELKTPPVAYPLRELRGEIEIENQQILLRELTAESGRTHVRLERGKVVDQAGLRPADFDLEITGLPLDERIPGVLTGSLKKVYNEVRPKGEVDLRAHLEFNGHDRWEQECTVTVRNGAIEHQNFRYPIEQIEGKITRQGELVDMLLQGRAGTQRVELVGRIKNPGPEAATRIVIKSAGIPIDNRLRTACPERFKNVIDQLQVQGELEGTVELQRPPGLGQKVAILVAARVTNGALKCLPFPYPLTAVSGRFRGSGLNWKFEDFRGRHGTAEIRFDGTIAPDDSGRAELELDFALAGAALDGQLLAALPEEVRAVVEEFGLKGKLNTAGRLYWSAGPGGRIRIDRLDSRIFDARMSLRSFPFSITDIAADISYDGRQVTIQSFWGRHDEITLRVDGGSAEYSSDGQWRVRLDPMFVDDLEATRQFRKSLPPQLGTIVETLNPRGKQSIAGMLEFRGKRGSNYPITAAWDTVTVYSGTTINAGVDLRDMHGKAYFSGTWDGEQADGDGRIELQSAKVFRYQLTDIHGPVRIKGSRLVLGSPPAPGRPDRERADQSGRLSAKFIEGKLLLDADVRLGDPMHYQVWLSLHDGELKRYAQLYMPQNNKLAGKMNGSISFKGEGTNPKYLTGSGQLVIKPAALYELPVIVQIFDVLRLVPPDNKAFDTALFVFEISGGVVHFGRIDLVGNSLKLVGRGTVGFDSSVRLQFISQSGRLQWPIPFIRETVNELTKGWIGVDVQGTLDDPKTRVRSLPQMDDALHRLFDPRSAQRR